MERNIFSYFNGEKTVKADPMQVQLRLISKNADFENDFNRIRSLQTLMTAETKNQDMIAQSVAALERLLDAARYAFNVEAYSGDDQGEKGLTNNELMAIFVEYMTFIADVKKKQDG